MAEAGWQVLFLGVGIHGAVAMHFPPHQNISVKEMPACLPGWKQKVHYVRYALWTLWWTITWRPKWIYGSDAISSPIVLAMSFLPGRRIIYHEHDAPEGVSVSHNSSVTRKSRFQRFLLWARHKTAGRARACVIPSEKRSELFRSEMNSGVQVKCVWNCPSRVDARPVTSSARTNELVLWYHGSIVPPQLPETVVRALGELSGRVKLKFAGYETMGHNGYVQHLVDLARQLKIGDRLEFVGTLPAREDLLQQCSLCDVGLALFLGQTRQPMVGASNKPFDYLSCGLALLLPNTTEWQDFFVRPGYGISCDPESVESVAAGIGWFLDHRTEARAMGEAGRAHPPRMELRNPVRARSNFCWPTEIDQAKYL